MAKSLPANVHRTENRVAALFAEREAGQLCHAAQHGRWYVWRGTQWQRDERGEVIERVRALVNELASFDNVRMHSAKLIHAVESLARSDPRLQPGGEFDAQAWLLGTPGGVIDLRDGTLRAAQPTDWVSRLSGCAPDFDATCARWLAFLDTCTQGDAALIAFLQKLCGYVLTGSTEHEFVFMLYGPGANGKTRFLTVLREILGDYFIAVPPETFLQSAHEQHPTGIARLQGARLAAASELPANRAWNSQRVKDIATGEVVAARFMRQDFFEFRPAAKLLFVGNHRPRLQQVDEAERRRFRLIPFTHRVPEAERDPDLADKLRPEYPAILAWMIAGAIAVREAGFGTLPAVVANACGEYFDEADTLTAWIDERLVFDAAFSAQAGILQDDYQRWFEASGYDGRPMGASELKQRLVNDYGVRHERTMHGRLYRGLALRSEPCGDD